MTKRFLAMTLGGICLATTASANTEIPWSTYFGHDGNDSIYGVATRGDDVFVVGYENSFKGATARGAFIARYTAGGEMVWLKEVGPTPRLMSIALNETGDLIVAGAFDADAMVMALDVDDGLILWDRIFGGSNPDFAVDMSLDAVGAILVTGATASGDMPVTPGAYQSTHGGGVSDAFVAKLSPGGEILWLTYLGGSESDYNGDLVITADAEDGVVVSSSTNSPDFPLTSPDARSEEDMFVTRFDGGGGLTWSRALTSSGMDRPFDATLDDEGRVWLAGFTTSPDFVAPATAGVDDAFALALEGETVTRAFTFGGSDGDVATGIAVADGLVTLAGYTRSAGLPLDGEHVTNPFDANNSVDAFVARFDALGAVGGTYLAGTRVDDGNGVALLAGGDAIVVGDTQSSDFPVANANQSTFGGGRDGFAARVSITVEPVDHLARQLPADAVDDSGGAGCAAAPGRGAVGPGALLLLAMLFVLKLKARRRIP
jgi:hypothetical protein